MRPVINVTTRRDGDKNQIVTNINYDQNQLSGFLKKINQQIKMALDYTHMYQLNSLRLICTSIESD